MWTTFMHVLTSMPMLSGGTHLNLLSASLTIPLICCQINSFRRAPGCGGPWPGGEKRRGGRASQHEEFEALGSLLLPYAATGVSLLAVWCLIGATPRGQPWTPVVTLPHGCNGLSARRMAVLWIFREPALYRHVGDVLI